MASYAIPESQFTGLKAKPRRKSRRMRKNYDVILLPDRMVKGRSPKGSGFNKVTRIKGRKPVMGDALCSSEAALWLRPNHASHTLKAQMIDEAIEATKEI